MTGAQPEPGGAIAGWAAEPRPVSGSGGPTSREHSLKIALARTRRVFRRQIVGGTAVAHLCCEGKCGDVSKGAR
jgi:hypothetical protein